MTGTRIDLERQILSDWRDHAACAGYPHEAFFPGNDVSAASIARAVGVCAGCQVTADCLEYALETNQRSGIWGGTTEDERRSLRRKWLAARRRSA